MNLRTASVRESDANTRCPRWVASKAVNDSEASGRIWMKKKKVLLSAPPSRGLYESKEIRQKVTTIEVRRSSRITEAKACLHLHRHLGT